MKYFHEMHILKVYKILNNEFISFYEFVIFQRFSLQEGNIKGNCRNGRKGMKDLGNRLRIDSR